MLTQLLAVLFTSIAKLFFATGTSILVMFVLGAHPLLANGT